MEQKVLKQAPHDLLNRPITFLEEGSLNDNLLEKNNENVQEDEGEVEVKEDKGKGKSGRPWRRWTFQYLTKDIEQAVFDSHHSKGNNTSLREFCKYIMKNGKKNELVICLSQPKPSVWFKQFSFIKHESLKQVTESRSMNVQIAVKEMGPGYRIIYDENAQENNPQIEHPFSQESKTTNVREGKERDDDDEFEESEGEETFGTQQSKQKDPGMSQESGILSSKRSDFYASQFTGNSSQRELISQWYLRIFAGETVDQIRKDFVQKRDANLALAFGENFDLLIKMQQNYHLLTGDGKQILIP